VARIVRVARGASELRRMFQTIIVSIPALGNVGSLLLLLFFIYAILGVSFFHSACTVAPYFTVQFPDPETGSMVKMLSTYPENDPCADPDLLGFDGFVSYNYTHNMAVAQELVLASGVTTGILKDADWLEIGSTDGAFEAVDYIPPLDFAIPGFTQPVAAAGKISCVGTTLKCEDFAEPGQALIPAWPLDNGGLPIDPLTGEPMVYEGCVCENVGHNANFRTFGYAFLTLIRMSTGEYWNGIQGDLVDVDGAILSPVYFLSFLILATFIMLNLVVAIMIINYDDSQQDAQRAVNQDHMDHFREVWEHFDKEGLGWIPTIYLPKLLEHLDIPLGFHSSKPMAKVAQKKALQELSMQLPDHNGFIHYTETLFALAYRNQVEEAVKPVDSDDQEPHEGLKKIEEQKRKKVEEVEGRATEDAKTLQQKIAVLSFQAVYRAYQERREKDDVSATDPLKRKLRPGAPAEEIATTDRSEDGMDSARPVHSYRDVDGAANP